MREGSRKKTVVAMAATVLFVLLLFCGIRRAGTTGQSADVTQQEEVDLFVTAVMDGEMEALTEISKGVYFGMGLKVDTEETAIAIFGEPGEIEIVRGGYRIYTYHFPIADMKLTFYDGILTNRIWDGSAPEAHALNHMTGTELTDFQAAIAEGCDTAEIVYQWRWQGNDVHYTAPHDGDYDESQVEEFVEDYLREQGMEQKQRAGEIYDRDGDLVFAYYFDETQERYCFVMCRFAWDVYCGTRDFSDAYITARLTCSVDDSTGLVTETQYDSRGKNGIAEVSYRREDGFPFPIIVDSWEKEVAFFLCRDSKMRFYEDAIVFDENGRIAGYQGSDRYESMFMYPSDFSYDADGRLIRIVTKAEETDYEYTEYGMEYRASMDFEYNENGELEEAGYWFSEWSHGGTSDSKGSIWYDSQGRMIHNTYYMTHGSHKVFYLYEDGEERPWAIVSWCIQDGFTFRLFVPVE